MFNITLKKHLVFFIAVMIVGIVSYTIKNACIKKKELTLDDKLSLAVLHWEQNRKVTVFSVKDATPLASRYLASYCVDKNVILSNVKLISIKSKNTGDDKIWYFTYHYLDRRNAMLNVAVDKYGVVDCAGVGPNFR